MHTYIIFTTQFVNIFCYHIFSPSTKQIILWKSKNWNPLTFNIIIPYRKNPLVATSPVCDFYTVDFLDSYPKKNFVKQLKEISFVRIWGGGKKNILNKSTKVFFVCDTVSVGSSYVNPVYGLFMWRMLCLVYFFSSWFILKCCIWKSYTSA